MECENKRFRLGIKRLVVVCALLAFILLNAAIRVPIGTHDASAAESQAIALPTGASGQSVVRDDSGVLTAVWVDGGIKWAQWTNAWSSPSLISADTPNDLRVTADDLGVVTIVWTSSGQLKARRLAGGSWNPVATVSTNASTSAAVSDRSGTTTVFLDTSPISASQFDGTTFTTPSSYSGAQLQAYSVDGQGRTYVAWKNSSNSCLYVARISSGSWRGIGASACTTYSMYLSMTSPLDGTVDLFYSMDVGCQYGYRPGLSARKYHFASDGTGTSSLIRAAQCPNSIGYYGINFWTALAAASYGHSSSILSFYAGDTSAIFVDNAGTEYLAASGTFVGPSAFPPIRVSGGNVYSQGAPETPTIQALVGGDGFLDVTWSAGVSVSPIISFTAATTDGTSQCTWISGPPTCRLENLVNGRYYQVAVRATSRFGTGQDSPRVGAFPYGPPDSPTSVSVSPTTTSTASVAFDSGANNGAWISEHTATCTSSDGGQTATGSAPISPILITGLTPARTYECTVSSTNLGGDSPQSQASGSFASGHPLRVSVAQGNGTVGSSDASFRCADSCISAWMSGTHVTLTANADAGWMFAGWTGDCAGQSPTCSVFLNNARGVSAAFTRVPVTTQLVTPQLAAPTTTSPATPTGVKVATSAKRITATFAAAPGTTYVMRVTRGKLSRTNSCTVKKMTVICSMATTSGNWRVTITPNKNAASGKPFRTAAHVI